MSSDDHHQLSAVVAAATEDEMPQPFRFLDLPAEIRIKIYRQHLLMDETIDLHPSNARLLLVDRLSLLQSCRQIFEECYRIFYGGNVFRVFPTHGDFFRGQRTLLGMLSPRCRAVITRLELRIGPGWTAPPRSWKVRAGVMGLPDLLSVRTLIVFVECDPSLDVFRGFRRGRAFFTLWATGLFRRLVDALPSLENVQFDAYPSVSKRGDLMSRLVAETDNAERTVVWGPTFQTRLVDGG